MPYKLNPHIPREIGGMKTTRFLCTLLHWMDASKCQEKWVLKSPQEIEAATGLDIQQQRLAVEDLHKKGLLEERIDTRRNRVEYRIDIDCLDELTKKLCAC